VDMMAGLVGLDFHYAKLPADPRLASLETDFEMASSILRVLQRSTTSTKM